MKELHVKVVYKNLTLGQCYRLHCNEHYQDMIAEHANTHRQGRAYIPLEGGGLWRRARFDYSRRVEGRGLQMLLQAVVPSLGHDEYTEYSGPHGGVWNIRGGATYLLPGCVQGSGTLTFKQSGADVHRTVRGQIACHILGLGAKIEAQIVQKTAESLQIAAAYTPHYVRRYPGALTESSPQGSPAAAHASVVGATLGRRPSP